MDDSPAWPARQDSLLRQPRGRPAPAATVGLMTAARALGIRPDQAPGLARRGEFPCTVIETSDGYRVSFAALLRILGSGPVRHSGQDAGQ
jgi:hypothetical protein